MTKKVKKMAFGGLNSAPTKTSLGGGRPAPVNPANINPIRTPGGGKPALINQPVRGPLPQATDPVRPIGGQPRPTPTGPMVPVRGGGMAPASVATMMKKGGSVKSSASKRADGIATKGKTKGRIV